MLSEDFGGTTQKKGVFGCVVIFNEMKYAGFYGDYFMANSMLLPTTISWRTKLLHCSEEMVVHVVTHA